MKKTSVIAQAARRNRLPDNYDEAFRLQMNAEILVKEFFDQVDECAADKISDFINALERKERGTKGKKISEENLQKLLSRVNVLLADREIKFSPQQIGILLNSLAGLGYKKEDLQLLDLPKFVEITNKQIDNFSAQDVSYVCNGFARLAYDKDELSLDVPSLSRVINRKINNFRNLEPAIALHAFAQMGFADENIEEDAKEFFRKLIKQAKKETPLLDERAVAGLVHSLAKMEMFDELFEIKEQITSAISAEKIENLSSESAFSLLQSQMICHLIYGEKFFDEEKIRHISRKFHPKEDEISDLQKLITNSLPKENIRSEQSVYDVGDRSIRNIDISYQIGNRVFFIEVDGPSHFFRDNNKQLQINQATKQRDALNEAAISELAAEQALEEFYYVKLSYEEIEKIVGRKTKLSRSDTENLNEFLADKLDSTKFAGAKKIEAKISEETPAPNVSEEKAEALELSALSISTEEEIVKKPERTIADIFVDLKKTRSIKQSKKLMHEARSKADLTDGKSLLHLAVADNNLRLVSRLINLGHIIDVVDLDGKSPLHIAAQNNLSEIAQKLIEEKANVNLKDVHEKTALEIAVEGGDDCLDVIKILAKSKIDPEMVKAVFERARENEHNPEITKVLSKVVESYDINFEYKKRLFVEPPLALKQVNFLAEKLATSRYAKKILEAAREKNRYDIISGMVRGGANLTIAKEKMMMEAIVNNHLNVAEALLGRGFDLAQPLIEGGPTALNFATNIEPVNIEMLNILISAGAQISEDMDAGKAQFLLKESLDKNQIEAACALIKHRSTVVTQGMLTDAAIVKNSLPLVRAIISKEGFNANSAESKSALLRSAAPNVDIGIFNELVKAGSDVRNLSLNDISWQKLLVALSHSEYKESFKHVVRSNIDKLKNLPFTTYNQGKLTCLFLAIINGHRELAINLINAGANANTSTIEGFSPLILAIDRGETDIARALIIRGKAEVKKVAQNGASPILLACMRGNEEIVNLLLENKKLEIDNKLSSGVGALHLAAASGNKAVVDGLIATKKIGVDTIDASGSTALYVAAQSGYLDITKSLVKAGARFNLAANQGATPLYAATDRNHDEVVDFLLTLKGIAANQGVNQNKFTPLHRAIDNKNYSIMRSLIKSGKVNIDLTTSDEISPLYRAAQANDIEAVDILIEAGADVNFATKKTTSALYLASLKGFTDVAKSLILSGRSEINWRREINGSSAIYEAAVNGHLEIFRMLLAQPTIDLSSIVKDKGGTPIIHLSASKGYVEITSELLATRKVDPDAADINGTTSLHLATQENHKGVVKILLDNKANVNAANIEGQTALHIAVILGHTELLRDLVEVEGIRFDLVSEGKTALDVAKKADKKEIIEILEEAEKRISMTKEVSLESIGLDFNTTEMREEDQPALQQAEEKIEISEKDLTAKEEAVIEILGEDLNPPSVSPKGTKTTSSRLNKSSLEKGDSLSTLS